MFSTDRPSRHAHPGPRPPAPARARCPRRTGRGATRAAGRSPVDAGLVPLVAAGERYRCLPGEHLIDDRSRDLDDRVMAGGETREGLTGPGHLCQAISRAIRAGTAPPPEGGESPPKSDALVQGAWAVHCPSTVRLSKTDVESPVVELPAGCRSQRGRTSRPCSRRCAGSCPSLTPCIAVSVEMFVTLEMSAPAGAKDLSPFV